MNNEFTYASLFAGIGGFESGLNKLGGRNVFASEIDKFARQSYEALYGVEPSGDITQIESKDIPNHDLLTAGFPCQTFSVAGKRAGMAYVCRDCEHEQTISFNQYADRDFVCEACGGIIEAVDGRGLLFFEVARVARDKQPKVVLLENVKGLVGHDKGRTLDTIVRTLSEIGYAVDFDVLNSKFYGVPQNRERIFVVAVREDIQSHEEWHEDSLKGNTVIPKGKRRIAEYEEVKTFNFDFPTNDKVATVLRDVLERSVDDKYYFSKEKIDALLKEMSESGQVITGDAQGVNVLGRGTETKSDGTSYCLKAGRTQEVIEPSIKVALRLPFSKNERTNKIYDVAGICPTPAGLGQGGGTEPKILDFDTTKTKEELTSHGATYNRKDGIKGHRELAHSLSVSDWRGLNRNQDQTAVIESLPMDCEIPQDPNMLGLLDMKGNESIRRVYDPNACGPTLTTIGEGHREPKVVDNSTETRIRKLTPKECWRLQGFTDEQHNAVERAGVSNTQRYKQAGNAVTVNVIEAIGEKLLPYLQKGEI